MQVGQGAELTTLYFTLVIKQTQIVTMRQVSALPLESMEKAYWKWDKMDENGLF